MFMNMKGGVGKTTLAVEISRTLVRNYAKNVLLIDYDPQANASFAFLETPRYFSLINSGKSLANCLAGCGRKVRRSAAVYGASTVSAAFGM